MSHSGASDAADAALVSRARAGDVEAFGQLVERHRRAVYRAALAALGSAAEADDAAQDACVAAFQRLSTFRGEASFKTWLLAIAWRCATSRRTRLRTWTRRLTFSPREDEEGRLEQVPAQGASAEETVAALELQRDIRAAIGTLPRKLRETLLLAGSGDCSYEEIGGMLEIPVGTVKWRVSEARRRVKAEVVRSQKAEDGRRKTEDGRRKAEGGRRKAEGGRRKVESKSLGE
ncbi:MAG TPA: sigma-70 family RNA polymerase sigma factor [Vicinamibacterales bacterium]|nr:sigma-70 family RNA polymerase sigma factor [Vicinamibacterales bacterium]